MRVRAGKVLFYSNGGSTAEQFAQWNYVILFDIWAVSADRDN